MDDSRIWIGLEEGKDGYGRFTPYDHETESEMKRRALEEEDPTERGSLLFRKTFRIDGEVSEAKISIAGLGYYYLKINGVSPDPARMFSPILSDYYKRVKYDVYDVSSLLRPGENCIAVEVGPGWYSGNPKWWGWQQAWYGNPRLWARLEAVLSDGREITVETDGSWRVSRGSVTFSCVYDGETQDLRLEPEGWDLPGFDDGKWNHAVAVDAPTDNLTESKAPPVRAVRTLTPVKISELTDTLTLFDFGENGAAVPRVTVRGKAGDSVLLRHSEFLYPDGTPDTRTVSKIRNEDIFILRGGADEVCMPRFCWHGYRWLTVEVSSPDCEILSAESLSVHSDVTPTGSFECGNEDLNRLHAVYRRTILACLQGVPIDCPQRHERKAWLGDAYAVDEASIYNFDMRDLYSDWLEDIRIGRLPGTGQVQTICPTFGILASSPDWSLAYPDILSECFRRYGDRSLLERHYPALKEHTEAYIASCDKGFVPFGFYGDWFTPDMPEGMTKVSRKPGPEEHRQNPPYYGTLFYCQTLRLTARVAEWLGFDGDARRFRESLEVSRRTLIEKYYHRDTGIFGFGGQFTQIFALAEDLLDEADRPAAFAALLSMFERSEYHPMVGVMGLRRLFEVLCRYGRQDVAWRVMTVKGYPGQLEMLTGDRTTLTEGLDGSGSGCHAMFASPDAFLYSCLGGITVDRTAAEQIVIAPFCPPDPGFVRCTQILPEGEVSVRWEREGKTVSFDISVPKGLRTRLMLNGPSEKYEETLDGGRRRVTLG